jgi:hypothetical protein
VIIGQWPVASSALRDGVAVLARRLLGDAARAPLPPP